ncbi:MAG TPA: hypothetical protein VKE71_07205 [Candidatus Angelobacter sp.]|nr:hypothetical protein [Candidatus Angelobacter sp.]
MKRRKWLYLLGGFSGLVGWLLFVLACTGWPAWSPDSRKVLFPYFNPDSRNSGIALYDQATGTVMPVFHELTAESNPTIPYAQFSQDGKQIIVALMTGHEDMTDEVLLLPAEGNKSARRFVLPESKQFCFPPFPQYGNDLFIGLSYIARLNLKTGAVETKELSGGKGIHLIPDGEHVWYVMYDLQREGHDEDDGFQVGELNRNDLSLKSLFEVWDSDLRSRGITHANILGFTPLPDGSGLVTSARVGDDAALVFFNRAGQDRVVKPQLPGKGYRLGGLAWSADGKTIYTTAIASGKKEGQADFSVAEIPVNGGPARLTWIARLIPSPPRDNDPASFDVFLQVSLSPDGHTLATTTGFLDRKNLAKEDRALYLIDLRDSGRKVTKQPIPQGDQE